MASTGEGSMNTSDTLSRFIIFQTFAVNFSFTKLVPQSNRLDYVSNVVKINWLLDCSVLGYGRHFSTYPHCIWNLQLLHIIILYQACPWFVLYLKTDLHFGTTPLFFSFFCCMLPAKVGEKKRTEEGRHRDSTVMGNACHY